MAIKLKCFKFRYFQRRRRNAAMSVYRIIALTDTMSCINVYPVISSFLTSRRPVLFQNFYFRQFWGLTWEPLPYYSVFLVLLISMLRTIGLLLPLRVISKRAVNISMATYAVFLFTRFLVGILFFGSYEYEYTSGYSYIHIRSKVYQFADLYMSMVLLMLPILPITGSAIIILILIRCENSAARQQREVTRRKHYATVTVLIFTCVYMVCNIPVTISVLRLSLLTFSAGETDILQPLHAPVFTIFYKWCISFIILVQLNASVNPVIYFLRMRDFRSVAVKLHPVDKQIHIINSAGFRRITVTKTIL